MKSITFFIALLSLFVCVNAFALPKVICASARTIEAASLKVNLDIGREGAVTISEPHIASDFEHNSFIVCVSVSTKTDNQ